MIREMMCLLALAGVMAGCTNDGSSELQRPETTVRLTAELQQGSRTVLGDDGLKVLWENQDRLGVFSDKGDANVSFLLSEGAGESVGRFEGALSKGAVPQYVYYPYSADAGTSTATLAVTVDAEQTQNGTTASIGANDFKIGSYDAAQKRFSLRNKLSLLAFTVDDLTGSELFGQPLDRIVLETDCPYLAPVPNRGKRNFSGNLPYVVEKLAEIKGVSAEEIIRETAKNARALYRITE